VDPQGPWESKELIPEVSKYHPKIIEKIYQNMLKNHPRIDFKTYLEFITTKNMKTYLPRTSQKLPKSMKIDPLSSQGSPGIPKRLKDAPMPSKRPPRDQKCSPKASKTTPKINQKRSQ
jgi:hypothetical protein